LLDFEINPTHRSSEDRGLEEHRYPAKEGKQSI
jgi:hypothetical protein